MSLRTILIDLGADLGIDITSDSERALAVHRINQAAQEIYEANDLIGSLREEVFDPNTTTQQVALPFYVGQIRGIRYYDSTSRQRITIQDIRSRWNHGMGNEVWMLRWRLISNKWPLKQNINNQSALVLSVPMAEEVCFNVTIIGQTSNSTRINETITFCPGDLTHTTKNNWKNIESIRKDITTKYDITVKDVDDVELSVIPNICHSPSYVILQVLDYEISSQYAIEILYKLAYFPFKEDDEDFIVGHSSYDKAIYWKYLEHEYARNKDPDGALAAHTKCDEVISQIMNNNDSGTAKTINFAPNPYFQMYPQLNRNFGPSYHRSNYPL